MISYQGSTYPWHDELVASGAPSAGGQSPPSPAPTSGAQLTLTGVARLAGGADAATGCDVQGISLQVPRASQVAEVTGGVHSGAE